MNIFNELVIDPDLEREFIDGRIVKAHQHSSGAAYEQESDRQIRSRKYHQNSYSS